MNAVLRMLFAVLLLICLLTTAALAEETPVALHKALAQLETTDAVSILLSDDFSCFDLLNSPNFTIPTAEPRYVVLRRTPAMMAYEKSKIKYSEVENLSVIGKPSVYLDVEATLEIPQEYRASETHAPNLFIFSEDIYMLTAEVVSTELLIGEEPDIKDVIDGLVVYLADGSLYSLKNTPAAVMEPEERLALSESYIRSIGRRLILPVYNTYYYPLFECYNCISLYNGEDGSSILLDNEIYSFDELRKDPECGEISDGITDTIDRLFATYQETGIIPTSSDEYSSVLQAINRLANLDHENSVSYMELDRQLKVAELPAERYLLLQRLQRMLDLCGYNYIGHSDSIIESRKMYIGQSVPKENQERLETTLMTISLLDWSPSIFQ